MCFISYLFSSKHGASSSYRCGVKSWWLHFWLRPCLRLGKAAKGGTSPWAPAPTWETWRKHPALGSASVTAAIWRVTIEWKSSLFQIKVNKSKNKIRHNTEQKEFIPKFQDKSASCQSDPLLALRYKGNRMSVLTSRPLSTSSPSGNEYNSA